MCTHASTRAAFWQAQKPLSLPDFSLRPCCMAEHAARPTRSHLTRRRMLGELSPLTLSNRKKKKSSDRRLNTGAVAGLRQQPNTGLSPSRLSPAKAVVRALRGASRRQFSRLRSPCDIRLLQAELSLPAVFHVPSCRRERESAHARASVSTSKMAAGGATIGLLLRLFSVLVVAQVCTQSPSSQVV